MAQTTLAQPNIAPRTKATSFKYQPSRFALYAFVIALCILHGFPSLDTDEFAQDTGEIVKFPPVLDTLGLSVENLYVSLGFRIRHHVGMELVGDGDAQNPRVCILP